MQENPPSLSFALLTFAERERRGPRLLLLAERKHAIPLALLKFEQLNTSIRNPVMAKAATVKIKLVSTADTGFYYVTKKNPRNITEKMSFRKYDPVARKHVEFKEAKIK